VNHPSIAASQPSRLAAGRLAACAVAFAIGVTLVFLVGFAHTSVLHNAAHDSRHALAFPCH
jgi:cobalt transporter subunit CbtB